MSDGEAPTIGDGGVVKARKRWHCCECRKPIEIGQEHEAFKGLWDGIWETYRTCISCRDLREAIRPAMMKEWKCDDFTFGHLNATLAELRTWSDEAAASVASAILQHRGSKQET